MERKKFYIRWSKPDTTELSGTDSVAVLPNDYFANYHNQIVEVLNNRKRQLAEFWF